jgi:hypothetical protein
LVIPVDTSIREAKALLHYHTLFIGKKLDQILVAKQQQNLEALTKYEDIIDKIAGHTSDLPSQVESLGLDLPPGLFDAPVVLAKETAVRMLKVLITKIAKERQAKVDVQIQQKNKQTKLIEEVSAMKPEDLFTAAVSDVMNRMGVQAKPKARPKAKSSSSSSKSMQSPQVGHEQERARPSAKPAADYVGLYAGNKGASAAVYESKVQPASKRRFSKQELASRKIRNPHPDVSQEAASGYGKGKGKGKADGSTWSTWTSSWNSSSSPAKGDKSKEKGKGKGKGKDKGSHQKGSTGQSGGKSGPSYGEQKGKGKGKHYGKGK